MALTLSSTADRLRGYIPDRGAGRTLALATFIDATGTGLFLAGAAIFFVRSIGLTAAQVGLGLSVGAAVGFATTVPIGVLLRDRDGGEVRIGSDGEPIVRYKLSPFDADHLRTGLDGAAQILEAAGARRIFRNRC